MDDVCRGLCSDEAVMVIKVEQAQGERDKLNANDDAMENLVSELWFLLCDARSLRG